MKTQVQNCNTQSANLHFKRWLNISQSFYILLICIRLIFVQKKNQSLNSLNTSPFKNNLISTFIVWWIPTEIWIFDWLKIIINYKPRVRKLLKEIKTLAVAQKYIFIYIWKKIPTCSLRYYFRYSVFVDVLPKCISCITLKGKY